jgi:molecular chaperone DnaJ
VFERRDNDLHCSIPVNVAQAALGVDVLIPTLEGTEPFKIPEGTQSGAKFRLKGRGVPDVNGRGRGDLYVHVRVQVPKKLTREQKKLFEELNAVLPADNEPGKRGLFDKVKDYFM